MSNDTGDLRVNAPLTNWTNGSMVVRIIAQDSGEPVFSSTAELFVHFSNVVKNAPVISPPLIQVSINEVNDLFL